LAALVHGDYPGHALPDHVLPGLCSVGSWDAQGEQSWGLGMHRNEGVEITFLERGSLAFGVDDQRYVLRPNDLTITRPWQPHCIGLPHVQAGRLHWVILDLNVRRPSQGWEWPDWVVLTEEDLGELTSLLRHNEHPVWHGTPGLRQCFQEMVHLVASDDAEHNVSYLTVHLNKLLVLLLEMLAQSPLELDSSLSGTERTVALFLTDLKDQLCEPWSIESMAQSCGLGVTRFIHYCRQITNMTPAHYLTQSRLEGAIRLLETKPEMSVTQVALACGFSSSQYFSTVFKRHKQCSPREFRLMHGL
jgi:AraC-like DNA-binding protein